MYIRDSQDILKTLVDVSKFWRRTNIETYIDEWNDIDHISS